MLKVNFITEILGLDAVELEITGIYRGKRVKIFLRLPAYLMKL